MSVNDYIYWETIQETGMTPQELYNYEHPKVIRCKKCKHWNANDVYCGYTIKGHTDADDFCSYGERKE